MDVHTWSWGRGWNNCWSAKITIKIRLSRSPFLDELWEIYVVGVTVGDVVGALRDVEIYDNRNK